MKASDRIKLNNYVAVRRIKRNGDQYTIYPWAFPSDIEYEELIQIMQEYYVFTITEEGVIAIPNEE